ncbi:plasmid replication initiation protein [Salinibacter ruber]|uniref:replication initiation protein n=1 Tax=Salinibacter ruber TaxID=146919 RepID=UPI00216909D3|nr:replication initiation protein [Salinibacter ruber]MCS3651844.1 plasmid replication initiation protein [Salinibacter ruber]MCS3658099.1 plasmid replication initiation protein [Salinibacter ruber]MCS3824005.1 plasmid replication initiation protein [Salinibacter ruber]
MVREPSGEMVVKANRMTQAKMPLSKVEHRIVGMLISQLEKGDDDFDLQKVYIRDLVERSDSVSQDLYGRAEEICDSLIDKSIKVRSMEDGKRVYDAYNLMSRCRYKEGSGYIEAKFNEEMRPLLLQLKKRFTMYDVNHFLPLSSSYSMRIYELLKMRESISILRITVEELRAILAIEDSYEYFSHLEHHVIKKAQEEIKEKTDIHFTYDVEREGRTAERIKFFIHQADGERTEKPKMEDRTEAPNIDVMDVFLSDLTQKQIDALSQERLDKLHERAAQQAEQEVPNRSKSVKQSVTLQRMKTLWESL